MPRDRSPLPSIPSTQSQRGAPHRSNSSLHESAGRVRGRLARALYGQHCVDVDDVLQDTVLEAISHGVLDKIRDPDHLERWLYRAALNNARDNMRSEQRRANRCIEYAASHTATDDEPPPTAALIAREAADAVRRLLANMPPRYQLALELRVLEQLPLRHVGRALGCSENAAQLLCRRASRSFEQAWRRHAAGNHSESATDLSVSNAVVV